MHFTVSLSTVDGIAWLLACDYIDGYCSTFALDKAGKIARTPSSERHFTIPPPAPVDPSPRARQTFAHPHEANFAPRRGLTDTAPLTAFVPDLGADRVRFLTINR